MNIPEDSNSPKYSQEEESNSPDNVKQDETSDEDADPPLDEKNLTEEEADEIVWEPPKTGSSGSEEKDITD